LESDEDTCKAYISPTIRSYEPPILKRWGDVSDLTLGGSGTRNDTGNMGDNWGNAPGEGGGIGGGEGGGKDHK
jgi:hypothetical protein